MAVVAKENLIALLKQQQQSIAQNAKTYIDQQDAAIQGQLNSAVTALNTLTSRVDLLDIIDDQDGVSTLVERFNTLETIFTSNGDLSSVLDAIADINNSLTATIARVQVLEDNHSALSGRVNGHDINFGQITGDINVINGVLAGISDRIAAGVAEAKAYADEKFLSHIDIADITANFCPINNVSAGVFGLPLVDCNPDENGDANAL